MTTTYFVHRDSATARTDEDRAMCHAMIAKTDDLIVAQGELINYMQNEVTGLISKHVSADSQRRAAEIMDGIGAVRGMTPGANSRTSIRTANLVWTIVHTEH